MIEVSPKNRILWLVSEQSSPFESCSSEFSWTDLECACNYAKQLQKTGILGNFIFSILVKDAEIYQRAASRLQEHDCVVLPYRAAISTGRIGFQVMHDLSMEPSDLKELKVPVIKYNESECRTLNLFLSREHRKIKENRSQLEQYLAEFAETHFHFATRIQEKDDQVTLKAIEGKLSKECRGLTMRRHLMVVCEPRQSSGAFFEKIAEMVRTLPQEVQEKLAQKKFVLKNLCNPAEQLQPLEGEFILVLVPYFEFSMQEGFLFRPIPAPPSNPTLPEGRKPIRGVRRF